MSWMTVYSPSFEAGKMTSFSFSVPIAAILLWAKEVDAGKLEE